VLKIHHLNLTLMSFKFIRDPDTTFNDLKPLRLVCKTFDIIWSPLVLSAISMFPRTVNNPDDILENLRHLHHLIYSPYHAKQFNTLIIRNWDCLNSQLYVYFAIIRLARYICQVAELRTVLVFLLTQPVLCITRFLYKPKKMPRRIASTFNRILAKYLAGRLPYKLQLRQVHCARRVTIIPLHLTPINTVIGCIHTAETGIGWCTDRLGYCCPFPTSLN
jgi:hypothetical protein